MAPRRLGAVMNHIETVRAHWSQLGTLERLPDRTEVRPDAFNHSIAWAFILEFLRGEPVFRLAGSAVCDLFALDMRDLPFMRVWSDEDADRVDEMLASSIGAGTEVVIHSRTTSVRGRTGALDIACFPLRQKGGGIAFLGAMNHDPILPRGIDRVRSIKLRPPTPVCLDTLDHGFSIIAERRGDRSDRHHARLMREAGNLPVPTLALAAAQTKR